MLLDNNDDDLADFNLKDWIDVCGVGDRINLPVALFISFWPFDDNDNDANVNVRSLAFLDSLLLDNDDDDLAGFNSKNWIDVCGDGGRINLPVALFIPFWPFDDNDNDANVDVRLFDDDAFASGFNTKDWIDVCGDGDRINLPVALIIFF